MRVYRRKFWGFVLAALLLIGLPAGADAAEGRALYVTATAYSAKVFADDVMPALDLVDYVGGCCGADASYIRELAGRMK